MERKEMVRYAQQRGGQQVSRMSKILFQLSHGALLS